MDRTGLYEAMVEAVDEKGRPFLGICVGMQLMARRGLEFGETPGLGWFAGDVAAIETDDAALKVPHMGWNSVDQRIDHRHELPARPGTQHGAVIANTRNHTFAFVRADEVAPDQLEARV